MTFTPAQIRMAVALLNIGRTEFAIAAGVDKIRFMEFCNGKPLNLSQKTIDKIQNFLVFNGIDLGPNDSVRRAHSTISTLKGQDGFRQLYDDYYRTLQQGGEMRLYSGVSSQVIAGLGEDYVAMHVERMTKIRDRINIRTLVRHGDAVRFGRAYSDYRWLPPEYFKNRTVYVYGNKTAYVNFCGDDLDVQLIVDDGVAEINATFFDLVWKGIAQEIPHEYDPA